jgi:8-oxo-dGTP diphosphatase
MMPNIELTNMCMVYDRASNKVLVQERVKSWAGISFPGGHVADGESIVESTIREVKEETGLTVSNLQLCGVIYWYNDETKGRYFVFNFGTDTYSGQLTEETDEGKVFWVDVDLLPTLNLAHGLRERLPMFLEGKYNEGFGTWNQEGSSQLTFY